eukprot:UN13878
MVLPWYYHDLRLGITAVKIKHKGCDTRCTSFLFSFGIGVIVLRFSLVHYTMMSNTVMIKINQCCNTSFVVYWIFPKTCANGT